MVLKYVDNIKMEGQELTANVTEEMEAAATGGMLLGELSVGVNIAAQAVFGEDEQILHQRHTRQSYKNVMKVGE